MRLLKSLLTLVVLVLLGQALWQVVPPLFYNYQFQDAIRQEAMAASYNPRSSEDDIQENVLRKATDLNVPLTRDQIRVQRDGSRVSISAAYTVHVDVPWHPFDMTFTPSTQNSAMAGAN
jgi:hypothetical protein